MTHLEKLRACANAATNILQALDTIAIYLPASDNEGSLARGDARKKAEDLAVLLLARVWAEESRLLREGKSVD